MLGYCSVHAEARALADIAWDIAAKLDFQDWRGDVREKLDDFLRALESAAQLELCCMDVVPEGTIAAAERVRSAFAKAQLLLIAEPQISPTQYLKPSIRATSLLLRPYTNEQARMAMAELMRDWVRSEDVRQKDCFLIDTRQGRSWIPYGSISYFEARERKIFLCMNTKEIPFYDTLENLEQNLPNDFLRCHKGFIVNRWHIDRIVFSHNAIMLRDGAQIPISRSYKSAFKDIAQ